MTALAQRPAHVPKTAAMKALGVSRAQAWPDRRTRRPRGGQARALSPAEREGALAMLHCERFCDKPPRQVHATLMSEGTVIASPSTLYRLLRSAGESAERRAQRPPRRHAVPRLEARAPHQVWTWDITKLPTQVSGVFLCLYVIIDLFSRHVVAWMVSRKENAGLARHLFTNALARHDIKPHQLIVHQDRGAPMTAHCFRDLLAEMGVAPSYSRPRVSNDNPHSESHFKTLKFSPGYPGRFDDADHARRWLADFYADYHQRPHQGLALYSPADVFHGRVEEVWQRRQAALDAHPPCPPLRALRQWPTQGCAPA